MAHGDKSKSGDHPAPAFGKAADRRPWEGPGKGDARLKGGGFGKRTGHQAAQHGGHRSFNGSQHSRH